MWVKSKDSSFIAKDFEQDICALYEDAYTLDSEVISILIKMPFVAKVVKTIKEGI